MLKETLLVCVRGGGWVGEGELRFVCVSDLHVASIIKLFRAVVNYATNKVSVFVKASKY